MKVLIWKIVKKNLQSAIHKLQKGNYGKVYAEVSIQKNEKRNWNPQLTNYGEVIVDGYL